MRGKIKRTVCLLLAVYLCLLLAGCYDSHEVDDQTYVIAVGIDKGKSNNLRLTLQYVLPLAIGSAGGGSGGGGGGGGQSVTNMTLECPSIFTGLNMANNSIGKQINLSHAKIMVFSDELARIGTAGLLVRSLLRDREVRPNLFIAISRGSAESYLESIKPVQEADPAKYYELKTLAYRYTGFINDSLLHDFYIDEESPAMQPAATLVGVNTKDSVSEFDVSQSTSDSKEKPFPFEGDYLAGDLPKIGDIRGEMMGIAVFDGGKMVGEMDGEDATFLLMVEGKYQSSYLTFMDPVLKPYLVVVNMKQSRRPSYKVDIVDGKPKISVSVMLEGDFVSIQSGADYSEDGLRIKFEKSAEDYLTSQILKFLNRTKQFNSDICGFGRYVKGKFLTWNNWMDFNWLKRYKDTDFNVSVDVKIRRPGLLIKDSPIMSTKGKVRAP